MTELAQVDPKVWLVAGAVACLGSVALVLAVAWGLVARARLGQMRPGAEAAMLVGLGYEARDHRWVRSADGLQLVFEAPGDGWRWTGRLRRYGAVSLRVEERDGEWPPKPREGAFLIGDPELDHRFRFLSARPAPALEVLATEGVGEALLAMSWLDLALEGDEVTVRDPERSMLKKRVKHIGADASRTLAAQARIHADVAALLIAIGHAIR